ncbi:MAG: acylphosphatase [Leptospirales bacterium]|nr:acylphosphatase [Leptospirales bacterium]
MEQKRFIVEGKVQGVGFRQFVLGEARKLGVTGFVRNLADGSVECLARGTSDQMASLEAELKRGPSWSQVSFVTSELDDRPLSGGFRIS